MPGRRRQRVVSIDAERTVQTDTDRLRSDLLDLVESLKSKKILTGTIQGVERLRRQARNLVIVSNEIFSDGCDYASETREYQRVLGTVNCRLAKMAEQVTEVVYGIPLEVKRQ